MTKPLQTLTLLACVALLGAGESEPLEYACRRAGGGAVVPDGKLDDAGWADVPWTQDFVDLATGEAAPLRTRAKMAWDDHHLHVAVEVTEPHVWADIAGRDEHVYKENAVELFIDPDGDGRDYAEIQVNARGTVCDLKMSKPYRAKGKADIEWDATGMRAAVRVDGTLNDPSDRDDRWVVELAIPWASLPHAAPRDGETWRLNVARVQWETEVVDGKYVKRPGRKGQYAAWSSHGEPNMHVPEKFGLVRFAEKPGQHRR